MKSPLTDGVLSYHYSHVGNVFTGKPKLYPVTWDLAKVEDLNENGTTYHYKQYVETVETQNWGSVKSYTKHSHIDYIENSIGYVVRFFTKERENSEIYDPFDIDWELYSGGVWSPTETAPNGDAFMEQLNTKLLETIQVLNPRGKLVREIVLCYDKINQDLGSKFIKNILIKVRERVLDASGAEKKVGDTQYSYYLDYNNKDENYGALRKVTGELCGSVTYEYRRTAIPNSATFRIFDYMQASGYDSGEPSGILQRKNDYAGQLELKFGAISGGGQYVVVFSKDEESAWLFNIDGVNLYPYQSKVPLSDQYKTEQGKFKFNVEKIFAGNNYIALIGNGLISILNWTGDDWEHSNIWQEPIATSGQGSFKPEIIKGNDNIIGFSGVMEIDYVLDQSAKIGVLVRNGLDWRFEKISNTLNWGLDPKTMNLNHFDVKEISVGQNFIAFQTCIYFRDRINDRNGLVVAYWNGKDLIESIHTDFEDNDFSLFSSPDHVLYYDEDGVYPYLDEKVHALSWNGKKFVRTLKRGFPGVVENAGYDVNIEGYGDNYFLVKGDEGQKLYGFSWDGFTWKFDRLGSYHSSRIQGAAANDFAGMLYAHKKWNYFRHTHKFAQLNIYRHDNNFNWMPYKDYGALGAPKTPKNILTGNDFFLVFDRDTKGNESSTGAYVWDGQNFIKKTPPVNRNVTNTNGNGYAIYNPEKDYTDVYSKFQNEFNENFYFFPVNKKIVDDGAISGSVPAVYQYSYDVYKAGYDVDNGFVRNGVVTTYLPGETGKVVTYFHNSNIGNVGAGDARYLTGQVYKTATYKESNYQKPISVSETKMTLYRNATWPFGVKQVRVIESVTNSSGIKSTSITKYNDENGLPNYSEVTNSNGEKRISKTEFAFKKAALKSVYQLILENNMLALPVQSLTYKTSVANANVVAATANTYQIYTNPVTGQDVPVADAGYVFNGTSANFAKYDFSESTSNPKWELTGKARIKFNSRGMPMESENPDGVVSAVMYGKYRAIPMASISNASSAQAGVLTGDYCDGDNDRDPNNACDKEDQNTSYLDEDNGWRRGGAVVKKLDQEMRHFQERSIFVEGADAGPSKLVVVDNTKEYHFSAWAYSANANTQVNLSVGGSHTHTLPEAGKWHFIKSVISAGSLSGDVTVRVAPANGQSFYVNDIRFFPAGAMVSTNYYSADMDLPVSSISAGNTFTAAQYDDFGRKVFEYGLDTEGNRVLLAENTYVYRGCRLSPVIGSGLADIQIWHSLVESENFTVSRGEIGTIEGRPGVNFSYDVSGFLNRIWVKPVMEDGNAALSVLVSFTGTAEVDFSPMKSSCLEDCKIPVDLNPNGDITFIKFVVEGQSYVLEIKKARDCWQYYAGVPAFSGKEGYNPVLKLESDGEPVVAFADFTHKKRGVVKTPGGISNHFSMFAITDLDMSLAADVSNSPYVSFIEHVVEGTEDEPEFRPVFAVKKLTSTGDWVSVGSNAVSLGSEEISSPVLALTGTGAIIKPFVAYIGNNSYEMAAEGVMLLGGAYQPASKSLRIVFSEAVTDAALNANANVILSADNGAAQNLTLTKPLDLITGETMDDNEIFIQLTDAEAGVLGAWDNTRVLLELAADAGLSGAPLSLSAAFTDNLPVKYLSAYSPNKDLINLMRAEFNPVLATLRLWFDQSIVDATFNKSVEISLSTDNGVAEKVTLNNDVFQLGKDRSENDNMLTLELGFQSEQIDNLANVGSLLEIKIGAGLVKSRDEIANALVGYGNDFVVAYSELSRPKGDERSVYVKTLVNGAWQGLSDFNENELPDGRVSLHGAKSLSMAVSALGVPFIAYIGEEEVDCSAGAAVKGCPLDFKGTNYLMERLVISKWNSATSKWGPVSAGAPVGEIGDILPITNGSNVKISLDGEIPYVIYCQDYLVGADPEPGDDHEYFESNGDIALIVRKFIPGNTSQIDGSHWMPVSDAENPTAQQAPMYFFKNSDLRFDFSVKGGMPMVTVLNDKYTSDDSKYYLTVVQHTNGKWRSYGPPDFITAGLSRSGSPVSMDINSQGEPIVAAIDDFGDLDRTISAYEFNCDVHCADPTLAGLSIKEHGAATDFPLSWDFRQYFLYYTLDVPFNITTLDISATPNSCHDFGNLTVQNQHSETLEYWRPMAAGGWEESCGQAVTVTSVELTTGQNDLYVRGWDTQKRKDVTYVVRVNRAPNPNPEYLGFEVKTSTGTVLTLTPPVGFNNGILEHDLGIVENAAEYVEIRPSYGENVKVYIDDRPTSTDLTYNVDLNDGPKRIPVKIVTSEKTELHIFNVYRYSAEGPIPGDPPPDTFTLDNYVIFKRNDGATIFPLPIGGKKYQINLPADDETILALKNPTQTGCDVIINNVGLLITEPGLDVPIDLPSSTVVITGSCFEGIILATVERKEKVNPKTYIVGNPESGEPSGFYTYRTLAEAQQRIQDDINTLNDPTQIPGSFNVYVIADKGDDLITSPNYDIRPFTNIDGVTKYNIQLLGVIKGSGVYEQLLAAYKAGTPLN